MRCCKGKGPEDLARPHPGFLAGPRWRVRAKWGREPFLLGLPRRPEPRAGLEPGSRLSGIREMKGNARGTDQTMAPRTEWGQ